jgi:hypothetical protein
MCEVASKLQNFLFFSLLAGNCGVETGSIATASATNIFNGLRWLKSAVSEHARREAGPLTLTKAD